MSETTQTPPVDPAAPAVEAPPAVAVATAQAALPGVPVPLAPAPKAAEPGGKKWLRIPQASFKQRIQREAETFAQGKLGVPLEEATRLLEVGRKAEKGLLDTEATTNEALKTIQAENVNLRRKVDKLSRAQMDVQKKHKREVRRLKDRQIEADLKATAARQGIRDVDYAVHLFAKEIASGKTTKPNDFFTGLRTDYGYLFNGTAAPVPDVLDPETAPPASTQPGEATPEPKAPGTPAPAVNVDDMDNRDFSRHAQSKYGFTPGMG